MSKRLLDGLGLSPDRADLYEEVERATVEGSAFVGGWVAESAVHLGWAIHTIQCLLDPEAVVIGGQMPDVLMARLFHGILRSQDQARPWEGFCRCARSGAESAGARSLPVLPPTRSPAPSTPALPR